MSETTHVICARCGTDNAISNLHGSPSPIKLIESAQGSIVPMFTCSGCDKQYALTPALFPGEPYRRCGDCNAPRRGPTCHKCGAETFEPDIRWREPQLPPIGYIRELAAGAGYAIGVHGSLERDLDLIAAPWVDGACSQEELIRHISDGLGARVVETEVKPCGRLAATIQIIGWYKPIDISVMKP